MSASDLRPTRMARVAVVAPREQRRAVLVAIADAGVMELDAEATDRDRHRPGRGRAADEQDDAAHGDGDGGERAASLLRDAPEDVSPQLRPEAADPQQLHDRGEWEQLAGEVELHRTAATAVEHGPATIVLGWVPEEELAVLRERLEPHGASVPQLPTPRWITPPTRLAGGRLQRSLRPLVHTYAIVPYDDVDPSLFAGITYVMMFGMMFGDLGHGLVLAACGLVLARSEHPRLRPVRRLWHFPVAAGLVAAVFGLLYGEAFGPTGLVPTLWLAPLEEPVRLLLVAIGVGAALIAASYAIGATNRWREGGFRAALYASSGIAGGVLFLGAAIVAAGITSGIDALTSGGAVVGALGVVLTFVGFLARSGGGGAGVSQAVIELFDQLIRIVANVVSFGRLAAFGLTHAAIGFAVWEGTQALWGPGLSAAAAVALFVVGHTLAFALEVLVIGVQALRLEYYELFSRIFAGGGRLFDPWQIPMATQERS